MAGIIFAFVFNYGIIEKILIPNPCYYHTHETNKVFDLFYGLHASEGFHPFPTLLNFTITGALGAVLGAALPICCLNKLNRRKTA
ncbi:MAG TPA: hypothetical protein PK637_10535 [Flavobacteriales bacterium]|nr:hypothetical protein [Flavobacteriales bacterium]HRE97194.1 hypothetical protein [Flavobacteriales bacterium]HRJ38687.1 hypothetical protein [Flavobacteriales bacterium]